MMMANPRRSSYSSSPLNPDSTNLSFQSQPSNSSPLISLHSLTYFLKKPQAFPILLSIFVFLTWVSLRLQSSSTPPVVNSKDTDTAIWSKEDDQRANLVRFSMNSEIILKDRRGWISNPVSLANRVGVSGGAVSCASVHVGEIRPGGMRGNHRHYTCNETFLIWGAKTKFRLENLQASDKGYAEVILDADEVAVAASPSSTAHALVNIDPLRTTYFLGCQDSIVDYRGNSTDFKVWNDL